MLKQSCSSMWHVRFLHLALTLQEKRLIYLRQNPDNFSSMFFKIPPEYRDLCWILFQILSYLSHKFLPTACDGFKTSLNSRHNVQIE